MGEQGTSAVRCPWCLKRMAATDEACPHCGRPVESGELRSLGGGADPVPGARREGDAGTELRPLGEGAVSEEEETAARMRGRGEAGPEQGQPATPPTPRPPTPRRRLRLDAMDERYRVEPMEVAPGQEPETSWVYIRGIARADKLFAAVLVILALKVLSSFMMFSVLGIFLSGAILWGVLSLQWWGYWLAIIFSLLDLLFALLMMASGMTSAMQSGMIDLMLIGAAWRAGANMFVVLVLYSRRQHFG
jgi:hypothetical protein